MDQVARDIDHASVMDWPTLGLINFKVGFILPKKIAVTLDTVNVRMWRFPLLCHHGLGIVESALVPPVGVRNDLPPAEVALVYVEVPLHNGRGGRHSWHLICDYHVLG